MRKWLRGIDWLAINTSALVLICGLWGSTLFQPHGHGEYKPGNETQGQNNDLFLGLSAGGWTAIFTFFLTGSTIGLWIVTGAAANAAKSAADALPIVERAYVYPEIFTFGAVLECVREATVYHLEESKGDDVCPTTCDLTFCIKNYGKTPAILKEVFVGFGLHPFGMLEGVVIPGGILGAGEPTSNLIVQMQRGLSRNEANDVLTYLRHIAFEGFIVFDDIWGIEQTTKFYFSWEHSTQRMELRNLSTERTARYPKTKEN